MDVRKKENNFWVSLTLRVALAMTLVLVGFGLGAVAFPAAGMHPENHSDLFTNSPPAANARSAPVTPRREFFPRPATTNLSDPPTVELEAITCVSSSDCWAVGARATTRSRTFTEHWDGASWTTVTSPNTGQEDFDFLNAVTCNSSTDCWAAGGYVTASFQIQTLVEHWDGAAWTIVPSPNTSATEINELKGVTCASVSDCWAVGQANKQTLVEHWNGNTWTIMASPNNATADSNHLSGVTCLSGSDCWAVGSYDIAGSSNSYRTLIEHWNATVWTIVSSPNPDIAQNELRSIACTTSTNCWAAGYFNDSNGLAALFEKWDGNGWTMTAPGSLVDYDDAFAVACSSATNCWATGNDNQERSMIQHWDGAAWTKIAAPNPPDNVRSPNLAGVTCNSAADCWAVGGGNSAGLIEHWNGTSWTVYPVPPIVRIHSVMRTITGTIAIDGVGPALNAIDIEFGSDLTGDFETLTTVTSDANGVFHVEDIANVPRRYYWATLP